MNIAHKKIWPIILISTVMVATLQILLNEAMIQIAQAQFGNIPAQLIMDISLTIAAHSALIAIVPVILGVFSKTAASYVTLTILLSLYSTITTGINAIAPMVVVTVVSFLIFYAWTRARQILEFLRIK
ncbi:hypothetical protein ACIQU2_01475 [Pseudomonas sp. NPDC098740]|uniref:hypothetical protein n=1 Tax=Pseudomonas sp. NPDC098740 TaxID=3364486 RepID=UPI00383A2C89